MNCIVVEFVIVSGYVHLKKVPKNRSAASGIHLDSRCTPMYPKNGIAALQCGSFGSPHASRKILNRTQANVINQPDSPRIALAGGLRKPSTSVGSLLPATNVCLPLLHPLHSPLTKNDPVTQPPVSRRSDEQT